MRLSLLMSSVSTTLLRSGGGTRTGSRTSPRYVSTCCSYRLPPPASSFLPSHKPNSTHYYFFLLTLTSIPQVIAAYGERWFRIWAYFLAYSTIISRQGSASVFQITAHKNLNAFHRMEGLASHTSLRISDRAKANSYVLFS